MKKNKEYRIAIVIKSLHVGGAEIFAVRLAKALTFYNDNCKVYLINLSYKGINSKELSIGVLPKELVFIDFGKNILLRLLNVLPNQLYVFFNFFIDHIRKFFLKSILIREKIDIVNSHLMAADTLCARALKNISIRFVISMHGSYESNFGLNVNKRKKTLNRADAIVIASEKNLKFLEWFDTFDKPIFKIYYGFQNPIDSNRIKRSDLGLGEEEIGFIMVARGDKSKGWAVAYDAFLKLYDKSKNIFLLLIGEGEVLEELKKKNKCSKVIFLGYQSDPIKYLMISDVGLLPTSFKGESLPNSIIEYLSAGLSVISTRIGDIPNMLLANNNEVAGDLLEFDEKGMVCVDSLQNSMEKNLDKNWLLEKKTCAREAFKKFSMKHCLENYMNTFLGNHSNM
ncbi:MAG: glycosyltransferase [Cytophagales bacterium]